MKKVFWLCFVLASGFYFPYFLINKKSVRKKHVVLITLIKLLINIMVNIYGG